MPTHAHLDHVGAVPYLANNFKAPVMCTPFTSEVLKGILEDDEIKLNNPIKSMSANSMVDASKQCKSEFVHTTHSTPQTVMIALHTRKGSYTLCKRLQARYVSNARKKAKFQKIRRTWKKGVLALICDSTYAPLPAKTPSESVAKQMLREVILTLIQETSMLLSDIFIPYCRLNSIVEFGQKMGRKVVFMGRSMAKYVKAAENTGIANFSDRVEILKYSNQVKEN